MCKSIRCDEIEFVIDQPFPTFVVCQAYSALHAVVEFLVYCDANTEDAGQALTVPSSTA